MRCKKSLQRAIKSRIRQLVNAPPNQVQSASWVMAIIEAQDPSELQSMLAAQFQGEGARSVNDVA
eukprot:341723-Amphidinium_carterae.1